MHESTGKQTNKQTSKEKYIIIQKTGGIFLKLEI